MKLLTRYRTHVFALLIGMLLALMLMLGLSQKGELGAERSALHGTERMDDGHVTATTSVDDRSGGAVC